MYSKINSQKYSFPHGIQVGEIWCGQKPAYYLEIKPLKIAQGINLLLCHYPWELVSESVGLVGGIGVVSTTSGAVSATG